jgi:hypothetical protein
VAGVSGSWRPKAGWRLIGRGRPPAGGVGCCVSWAAAAAAAWLEEPGGGRAGGSSASWAVWTRAASQTTLNRGLTLMGSPRYE